MTNSRLISPYFEAMEELASVIQGGRLRTPSREVLNTLDSVHLDGGLRHLSFMGTHDEFISVRRGFALLDPVADPEKYRRAKNMVLTEYIANLTDALEHLHKPGDEELTTNNDDRNNKYRLTQSFTNAVQVALGELELSPKYRAFQKSIRDGFLESVFTSASLESLAQWQFLDEQGRKDITTRLVTHDFMTAAGNAESCFRSVRPPAVIYKELDGDFGNYYDDEISIDTRLLADDTPEKLITTTVHEGGHYLDDILLKLRIYEFETDVKLLSFLSEMQSSISDPVYMDVVYEYTPFEKLDFDQMVANPVIKLVDEYNAHPVRRFKSLVHKTVPAVSNLFRSMNNLLRPGP